MLDFLISSLSVFAVFGSIRSVAAANYSTDAVVVPLNLSSHLNNKGTGDAPGQADFNGAGWSIPSIGFPTNSFQYRGIHVRSIATSLHLLKY